MVPAPVRDEPEEDGDLDEDIDMESAREELSSDLDELSDSSSIPAAPGSPRDSPDNSDSGEEGEGDDKRKGRTGVRCHVCRTSNTPAWRRTVDGRNYLCNACGEPLHSFVINIFVWLLIVLSFCRPKRTETGATAWFRETWAEAGIGRRQGQGRQAEAREEALGPEESKEDRRGLG